MIYDPNNPYEKEEAIEYFNKLINGTKPIEVKSKNPKRTLSQNNYMHLILAYFGIEYGYSLAEVKLDYFKRKVNKDIFVIRTTNKQGKEIITVRSSADLDSMEMTTAIERFRNWSSAVAGIYLPSPDEDNFILHIQKEIERNKEFI